MNWKKSMTGVWSRRLIAFVQKVIHYCGRSTQRHGLLHRILHMQPQSQHTARFHHFRCEHGIFWSLFPCDNSNNKISSMILSRYEEDGVFNDEETDYESALDCIEEQEDNETYYFTETDDVVSSWDHTQEEIEDIDDEETDDELDSQVGATSDWDEEDEDEDEELTLYVAHWEDSSVEEEELPWYINEDGSWVDLSSATDGHLSEETMAKTLKTRDSKMNSDEHEICVVCQECLNQEDDKIAKLECGHEYHVGCIKSWLIKRNICPLCKAKGIEL